MKREELLSTAIAAAINATKDAAHNTSADWAEWSANHEVPAAAAAVAATKAANVTTPTKEEVEKLVKKLLRNRILTTITTPITAVVILIMLSAAIAAINISTSWWNIAIFSAITVVAVTSTITLIVSVKEEHPSLTDDALIEDVKFFYYDDTRRRVHQAAQAVEDEWVKWEEEK